MKTKRIAILNTSILTAFGSYEYAAASLSEVCDLLNDADVFGIEILSAIGHQSTADILSALLPIPVAMNRITYQQEIDDIAVIFKLNGRPEEGKILSVEEIDKIGYQFGFLRRTA